MKITLGSGNNDLENERAFVVVQISREVPVLCSVREKNVNLDTLEWSVIRTEGDGYDFQYEDSNTKF